MSDFRLPLFVVIGGAAGAGLRYGIGSVAGSAWWVLLLINLGGSLLIGWLIGRRLDRNHLVWAGVGVGFCGGLTSFSSFALQIAQRFNSGQWAGGLGIGVTTSVVAVVAAGVGYRLGMDR